MEQCYIFLCVGFLSEFSSFSVSVRTRLGSVVFFDGVSELLRASGIVGLRELEFSTLNSEATTVLSELVASLSPSPFPSSVRTSLFPQNRNLIDLGEFVKI